MPVWGYFVFSHAIHLLAAVFEILFHCGESTTLFPLKPLILTHPAKIIDNCLLLRLFRQFFCVCSPDIISKPSNKNKKFFIPQCTIENSRTKTMVTRCQKNARHVFMFSSDKYKKAHQTRFSTAGYL